jgi:hypothetical protein
MTPRTSAFTAGLAVFLVAAAAGCRGRSQPAPASLPPRPLALMPPGDAPLVLRTGSVAIGAAGLFWLAQRLPWPRYVA